MTNEERNAALDRLRVRYQFSVKSDVPGILERLQAHADRLSMPFARLALLAVLKKRVSHGTR